jgi:opacity protein-like surface antigen
MNKIMRAEFIAALLLPIYAATQSALAQGLEPARTVRPLEIIASAAAAHVFRFDDQGFRNHLNFGVGVEAPVWRKLRLGAEINRTFGFSPGTVKCGAIGSAPNQPLPCAGSAREGVAAATAGSITATYLVGEERVQPYVLGGIGIVNAKMYTSSAIVRQNVVEFREIEATSTGIGPALGGGVRVSISRHIAIRPEIRFLNGIALSSLNLSQWRISIGAAYGW